MISNIDIDLATHLESQLNDETNELKADFDNKLQELVGRKFGSGIEVGVHKRGITKEQIAHIIECISKKDITHKSYYNWIRSYRIVEVSYFINLLVISYVGFLFFNILISKYKTTES